ncbi:MAG: NAD-dependent epimerase/dehydratase family protein [Bryobacteraceae bacterium]|jgi:nucleoside-diphosphate-sugar epimerase
MKIFVAGATGVLGRASLHALIEAGHQVRATGRGKEKSELVRSLGAEPLEIDLFDESAVRQAVSGMDAVLRLTTKIPSLTKMRSSRNWDETNRLRTEGARIMVDAAIARNVPVYVHESITFVYQDGGTKWLTEDAPVDDGDSHILRATLEGEQHALRFSNAGGRGIVLRFGGFYGADAPSTSEMANMARHHLLFFFGSGSNYFSSIHVPDAGRAVAAALSVPAGIYNVCDDSPVPFAENLRTFTASMGLPSPIRLPAFLSKWMFGDVFKYLSRSLRVSNARLKQVSTWTPQVRSVSDGWPLIAGQMKQHSANDRILRASGT